MGCGHRYGDADQWGVVRYLAASMSPELNLTNYWASTFTNPRNQRIVDTLARKIIALDPQLQEVVGDQNTSPCERLAVASKAAYGGGSSASTATSAVPVSTRAPSAPNNNENSVAPVAAPEAVDGE